MNFFQTRMMKFYHDHFLGLGGINHLLNISTPIIISQASESLMMFTDRFLLTSLGKIYPSSSMTGGFSAHLLALFFHGILCYINPLVGQYLGAKRKELCAKALAQGIFVSFFAYIFVFFVGNYFINQYFDFVGIPEDEKRLALQYFHIINAAVIFEFLGLSFSSFFSGISRTAIIMKSNLMALLLNIPISYLLIHGYAGENFSGIKGAAYGTAICMFFKFLMLMIHFFRKENREEFMVSWKTFRIDFTVLKDCLYYGWPTGLEFFLIFSAFSTFVALFHSYGANEALAMTITFNWDIVVFFPMWGLNVGMMGIVGQAMGAKNIPLALRITSSGAKLAYTIALSASLIFVFNGINLVSIFMPDDLGESFQKVLGLGTTMLKMVSIYCIFTATNLVVSATLRASGDTRFCMIISIIANWLMLSLSYLSIRIFQWSPITTWTIFVVFVAVEAIFFYLRFRQGHWQKIEIVRAESLLD